jgi:hypothetical protein
MKLVSPASLRAVDAVALKATRLSLARSESTLFPTRLALARWTAGGNLPHLYGNANAPLRAAWLNQAERHFQAWLDGGGFVQHDDEALEDAVRSDVGEQTGCARLRIVHCEGNAVDAVK